jgi:predicted nucleotidyltransferase
VSRKERPLEAAIVALAAALEETGAPFMLIGGIAVIARGVARVTTDVDATIRAGNLDLSVLIDALARNDIVGRIPDLAEFATAHQVLLLRHEPTGTPIEVSLASLPFEEEALARAEHVPFATRTVPVAVAEDLVVYKAVAWRERDRNDIERLLVQHASTIDLGRVRRLLRAFADVVGAPERVREFEALVQRATDRR